MSATPFPSKPRQQERNELVPCAECGTGRTDLTRVCPKCGAGAARQGDQRGREEEVRQEDLEPYVALRYIARLFKVLAALLAIMYIGEAVTGVMTAGMGSLVTLLGEGTRALVFAGLMWAGGDIAVLLVDAGHDLRVARILLGRMNTALQERTPEPDVESIAGGSRENVVTVAGSPQR